MFGKKQNDNKALFREVDDSRQIVNDFRRRIGMLFEDYRLLGYKLLPDYNIEQEKQLVRSQLQKLTEANAVDSGNDECLDSTIIARVCRNISYLKDQRIQHEDFLERYSARVHTDYVDFRNMLEYWEGRLAALEEEHKETVQMNREYNANQEKKKDFNRKTEPEHKNNKTRERGLSKEVYVNV